MPSGGIARGKKKEWEIDIRFSGDGNGFLQFIERALHIAHVAVHHVGINLGCFHVFMSEQLLEQDVYPYNDALSTLNDHLCHKLKRAEADKRMVFVKALRDHLLRLKRILVGITVSDEGAVYHLATREELRAFTQSEEAFYRKLQDFRNSTTEMEPGVEEA